MTNVSQTSPPRSVTGDVGILSDVVTVNARTHTSIFVQSCGRVAPVKAREVRCD
jgi:hypothetical protein